MYRPVVTICTARWNYVFCIYLRTNSDLCHLQHKRIGFYNRDEKCLLRGTDWEFKYNGLRFICKGLIFICFVFIWEQTATCATYSINWLVFITEMKSVYCAVRTGNLNKAVCASSLKGYMRTNSDLCHLQHKLFGFYNRDEKCLLRGMDWVFK